MLPADIKDGPLPVQILEQHYEALHGVLPKAYLVVKAKIERTVTSGQSSEDLNAAVTAELFHHVPKPLFIILEEEFRLLHGALPDSYLTKKQDIIGKIKALLTDIAAGTRETEAADQALRELNGNLVSEFYRSVPQGQAALCLSGGGIRSATFGLGVLQG